MRCLWRAADQEGAILVARRLNFTSARAMRYLRLTFGKTAVLAAVAAGIGTFTKAR